MHGFVRGLLWGSLAAAGGLVVVSQIAGPVLRPTDLAQDDGAVTAVDAAVETVAPDAANQPDVVTDRAPAEVEAPVDLAEAAADTSPAPLAVTQAPEAPESAGTSVDAPTMPSPADSAVAQPLAQAPAVPQADSAIILAPPPAEPPVAPPSDAPAEALASAGRVSPPAAPAAGDAPLSAAQPDSPRLPTAETTPVPADLPPPPPLTPEEEALLLPLPQPAAEPVPAEPELSDPTPEPMPVPIPIQDPEPDTIAEGEAPLAPVPELVDPADGVVTGRLPRIGADPAPVEGVPPVSDVPSSDVLPDLAADEDAPPRQRYARPFENVAQKPLFAILLQDDGQDGVNRAELAALDLPLSIVIDPLSDGAADRAAIWRAGGQEVVMAGTGIPVGAGPGDLEQSFQVLASRLPEAVAVIDPDGNAFQNNRQLAAQVVPVLAEQGRGLVTFDQGLNAADQVARREGLPAAMIFRSIDGADEDSPVIRRYLDRAAFKAAQEGRVIVIGALRPQTVAGILEWAVEGRASTVALAPVSALLRAD